MFDGLHAGETGQQHIQEIQQGSFKWSVNEHIGNKMRRYSQQTKRCRTGRCKSLVLWLKISCWSLLTKSSCTTFECKLRSSNTVLGLPGSWFLNRPPPGRSSRSFPDGFDEMMSCTTTYFQHCSAHHFSIISKETILQNPTTGKRPIHEQAHPHLILKNRLPQK